jgi:hypothetical protein
MTTINPNIPERLRIAEAFAITWEMILPFAISGVLALAGRTLSMRCTSISWAHAFNELSHTRFFALITVLSLPTPSFSRSSVV